MSDPLVMTRLTPLDSEYPTCERLAAELRIYPSRLNVDAVTEVLKVAPTFSKNRGDIVPGAKGRTRTVGRTFWCLTSADEVASKDLRDHLDWILERIPRSPEPFKRLALDEGLKMSIACIWWSLSGHGGPTLWPEQMKRLSSLGLECTFDVQFYGDDE